MTKNVDTQGIEALNLARAICLRVDIALLLRCLLMAWVFGLAMVSACAHAADSTKTLRLAFPIAETSYDNAVANDEASQSIGARIIEPMLEYHYLARPVQLVPRTLESMPLVSDNGATFLCNIRKGIFFADDRAFKGKPRELTAADYAYSLKRLLDPKVKSPWYFLLEGKLIGGDEARASAVKSGRFDYDAKLPGLELLDRYTLRIRLKATDYNFAYVLAMPSVGAAAREAVEMYGADIGSHPVGTGAYQLARDEYKRARLTVLVANPTYRKRTWDWVSSDPEDQALIKTMVGKSLPAIGRIEVNFIEEAHPQWLAFVSGQHDYLWDLPASMIGVAKTGRILKPELAAKGIRLVMKQTPTIYYTLFNMTDPIVGGDSIEKIALRRAIQYAFPLDEQSKVLFHGDPIAAKGVVPPNVTGHSPTRPRTHQYDPALARALLDRFGYIDRDGDGYREMPDGSPLVVARASGTVLLARQMDELWKRAMDAVGIKMTFEQQKLVDRRKAAREGQAKLMNESWTADHPDAENFLQLLYGGNAVSGGENYSRFKLKAFDERYKKMRALPDGPARNRLISEMEDLVKHYAPWIVTWHDTAFYLEQPWFIGFKKHPIAPDAWEYVDVTPRRTVM
ncbi:MAG: heme-binding protein [Rhizobacter sp.]|nr:heme-binding protein [Burkholderiales bacterium]